jgi:hypothetical protein
MNKSDLIERIYGIRDLSSPDYIANIPPAVLEDMKQVTDELDKLLNDLMGTIIDPVSEAANEAEGEELALTIAGAGTRRQLAMELEDYAKILRSSTDDDMDRHYANGEALHFDSRLA